MDIYHIALLVGAFAGGGFFNRVWDSLFGGKKRKLDEAGVLSELSKQIREEIREDNKDLRDRMDLIVVAVCGLTDTLDDFFPKITGLTDGERIVLRERMSATRRATVSAGIIKEGGNA